MYKGRIDNILLCGLTDENIARLKGGEPIEFPLSALEFDSALIVHIEYTGPIASLAGRKDGKFILALNDDAVSRLAGDTVVELPPEVSLLLTAGAIGRVLIFSGRDEQAIHDWLKEARIIKPETEVRITDRLKAEGFRR